MTYGTPSPFPPSFDGNPLAYGFGLFGDVVAASLALAWLLTYLFEARRKSEIDALLRNPVAGVSYSGAPSALAIYRIKNIALLTFVVMRTLPDAVWMLLWGEVSETAIRIILALDLWCDGLALGPLFLAAGCWAWSRQVIEQRLVEAYAPITKPAPWRTILRNGRIVLVVLVIACGVTIGKVSG